MEDKLEYPGSPVSNGLQISCGDTPPPGTPTTSKLFPQMNDDNNEKDFGKVMFPILDLNADRKVAQHDMQVNLFFIHSVSKSLKANINSRCVCLLKFME
jgi:hypothetical protein